MSYRPARSRSDSSSGESRPNKEGRTFHGVPSSGGSPFHGRRDEADRKNERGRYRVGPGRSGGGGRSTSDDRLPSASACYNKSGPTRDHAAADGDVAERGVHLRRELKGYSREPERREGRRASPCQREDKRDASADYRHREEARGRRQLESLQDRSRHKRHYEGDYAGDRNKRQRGEPGGDSRNALSGERGKGESSAYNEKDRKVENDVERKDRKAERSGRHYDGHHSSHHRHLSSETSFSSHSQQDRKRKHKSRRDDDRHRKDKSSKKKSKHHKKSRHGKKHKRKKHSRKRDESSDSSSYSSSSDDSSDRRREKKKRKKGQ